MDLNNNKNNEVLEGLTIIIDTIDNTSLISQHVTSAISFRGLPLLNAVQDTGVPPNAGTFSSFS